MQLLRNCNHTHLHWVAQHRRYLLRQLKHRWLLLLLYHVLLPLPHAWRQLRRRRHAQQPLP
jgi:hypothetical protein